MTHCIAGSGVERGKIQAGASKRGVRMPVKAKSTALVVTSNASEWGLSGLCCADSIFDSRELVSRLNGFNNDR